jgi:hypothetical protein
VPIGPAARARAAQLEAADAPPPSADAFWSEDSAALHDAVQAPAAGTGHRVNPPVGLVAPVAGQWRLRFPHVRRLRGLRGLRGPRGVRARARWALLAVPAVAMATLAVLAIAARPTGPRTAAQKGPAHGHGTTVAQDAAASGSTTSPKSGASASSHRIHRVRHAHARPRGRDKVASKRKAITKSQVVHKSRPPTAVSHPSAAPTVTEASVTPVTTAQTTQTTGASSASDHSSKTASTAASEGSKPSNSPGPIGIGSMTGRCNPRCP